MAALTDRDVHLLQRVQPDPLVTVLLPTKNEERDIRSALRAIAAQDYPLDAIEVIVVDSGSGDDTAAVAEACLGSMGIARHEIIANPGGNTAENLNLGLAAARGRTVCRVDARSLIAPHHVRRCVEILATDPSIAVVGGAQVAVARSSSSSSIGIARALNNRWAMGFARYRRGAASGPADTVYLGSFRTEDLREVDGWNERFPTNQDFELNRRLGASATVWFDSALPVGYLPRQSVTQVFKQYLRFGSWKVTYWRQTGDRPRPRQAVLIAGPPLLAAAAATGFLRAKPRTRAVAGAAAAAAALALEVAGTDGPKATGSAHAWGVAALLAVVGGWTLGIWRGLFHARLQ